MGGQGGGTVDDLDAATDSMGLHRQVDVLILLGLLAIYDLQTISECLTTLERFNSIISLFNTGGLIQHKLKRRSRAKVASPRLRELPAKSSPRILKRTSHSYAQMWRET